MTSTEPMLLKFEDFRREVGATGYRVRIALAALHLDPVVRGRETWYRKEWIAPVREYLAAH